MCNNAYRPSVCIVELHVTVNVENAELLNITFMANLCRRQK
jgi:hypothetical protein